MRVPGTALVGLAAALCLGAPGPAAALTPEEEIGKRIYFEGRGAGGSIDAIFGRDNVRMPAVLVPCVNCHGSDGLGLPEGGMVPTPTTWQYLTKPYGHRHPSGRTHGPYDEDSVIAMLAGGLDPDGNLLDPLMPRYDMDAADFDALIAFLKRLDSDLDPGLSETAIRIGTLLPRQGGYGPIGQAVEAAIRAYFDDINGAGGIFGRKLELVAGEYTGDPAQAAANARSLVEEGESVFAVLSPFTLGVEREVFAVFEEAGVPQIDPFTLFAGHGDLPAELTFFLLSGLPDQARALFEYSARHLDPAPRASTVVLPPTAIYDDLARAVADQARRNGQRVPTVLRLAGDDKGIAQAVTELRRSGIEALFFFGDTAILGRLAAMATARDWQPRLFLAGPTAGRAVFGFPESFDGRIHLAYPNLPEDQSEAGRKEFRALREKHALSPGHLAAQVRALAAAKVLVEGLRRGGRQVTRAGMMREIENLDKFDTGQLPPLSFGSNRRVGVRGAHVLTVDLAAARFRPEAVWVDVD